MQTQMNKLEESKSAEQAQVNASANVSDVVSNIWLNEPVQMQKISGVMQYMRGGGRDQSVNKTGLPDKLKSGMESLSGFNLDHVQVHRNSAKPAAVQAHAFAQGSEIHLGAGQERHLPHELGHVVQQMSGMVKPTKQFSGVGVNDDVGLERGADRLGAMALQLVSNNSGGGTDKSIALTPSITIQGVFKKILTVGEIRGLAKQKYQGYKKYNMKYKERLRVGLMWGGPYEKYMKYVDDAQKDQNVTYDLNSELDMENSRDKWFFARAYQKSMSTNGTDVGWGDLRKGERSTYTDFGVGGAIDESTGFVLGAQTGEKAQNVALTTGGLIMLVKLYKANKEFIQRKIGYKEYFARVGVILVSAGRKMASSFAGSLGLSDQTGEIEPMDGKITKGMRATFADRPVKAVVSLGQLVPGVNIALIGLAFGPVVTKLIFNELYINKQYYHNQGGGGTINEEIRSGMSSGVHGKMAQEKVSDLDKIAKEYGKSMTKIEGDMQKRIGTGQKDIARLKEIIARIDQLVRNMKKDKDEVTAWVLEQSFSSDTAEIMILPIGLEEKRAQKERRYCTSALSGITPLINGAIINGATHRKNYLRVYENIDV